MDWCLETLFFVSKMLLNCEVWHSLTKAQIEKLESIDRILFRNILDAHSKTGVEWFYSETGKMPLRFLIQYRRLMYLWHIVNRDKSELIYRVYEAQKNSPVIGDWCNLVESDKIELGISLTEMELKTISKTGFKNIVKKKIHSKYLCFLNELKMKHSKSEYLECSTIKMADYLQSAKFTTREKRLLFKLRSRTLDVKGNFPGQFKDLLCHCCNLAEETQSHLLQCEQLVSKLQYLKEDKTNLNEMYIYGNLEQQEIIVRIYSDILEARDNLLIAFPSKRGPSAPGQNQSCSTLAL